MSKSTLIGYRIKSNFDGKFVHRAANGHHYLSDLPSEPLPRPDAYRRIACFFDENDAAEDEFEVVPVHRELTPEERMIGDLSALLKGLCGRYGIVLQMSDEQVREKLAQGLKDFGIIR